MRTEILIQDKMLDVWIQGEYKKTDKNAVAIVGSRKFTKFGEAIASQFSYTLAKSGITIVSGLALGIDTFAHRSAIDAKGRTIAVLAHGIDRIYPPENIKLASEIVNQGCLITKYPPGTIPYAKNFLARNQLIAGLSKAVIVIEGEERSGSISTANHAANLGIEVFAVPGSPATDRLISLGANIANEPLDILNYLSSLS